MPHFALSLGFVELLANGRKIVLRVGGQGRENLFVTKWDSAKIQNKKQEQFSRYAHQSHLITDTSKAVLD